MFFFGNCFGVKSAPKNFGQSLWRLYKTIQGNTGKKTEAGRDAVQHTLTKHVVDKGIFGEKCYFGQLVNDVDGSVNN